MNPNAALDILLVAGIVACAVVIIGVPLLDAWRFRRGLKKAGVVKPERRVRL